MRVHGKHYRAAVATLEPASSTARARRWKR